MKTLAILGSTGSIGANALEIAARYPDKFRVAALAGGKNCPKMEEQIRRFRPDLASVLDEESARQLRRNLSSLPTRIVSGSDGLMAVATHPQAQMVVAALVGSVGLLPTLAAVQAGKHIAIANKETLVMAGEILVKEIQAHGINLLPIDSEHSAIFQVLAGHRKEEIKRILLTASGGPFLNTPLEALNRVTPGEALNHPQWRMGKKVTVDSASLMNKGLEVIEAHWLFGVPGSKIEVLIHPQSIIHSMIEYIDGSVIAQMALPDMRGPIAYALSYPERLDLRHPSLDLFQAGPLTFCPGPVSGAGTGLPSPGSRRNAARRSERGQRSSRGSFSGGASGISADSPSDPGDHGAASADSPGFTGRYPECSFLGPAGGSEDRQPR
jgi:1-deoxy-D-xylulose-5-phosphate reductoisomerase